MMHKLCVILFLLCAACSAGVSDNASVDNAPRNAPGTDKPEPLPTDDVERLEAPEEFKSLKPPTPLDDADFIARGKKLYGGEAACSMCHGETGKADTFMAKQYTDPAVPDLTNPLFHNSVTDQYIYWRMVEVEESKVTPMSSMTGYAAVATDGEITEEESEKVWAVVAYVRSLRKD